MTTINYEQTGFESTEGLDEVQQLELMTGIHPKDILQDVAKIQHEFLTEELLGKSHDDLVGPKPRSGFSFLDVVAINVGIAAAPLAESMIRNRMNGNDHIDATRLVESIELMPWVNEVDTKEFGDLHDVIVGELNITEPVIDKLLEIALRAADSFANDCLMELRYTGFDQEAAIKRLRKFRATGNGKNEEYSPVTHLPLRTLRLVNKYPGIRTLLNKGITVYHYLDARALKDNEYLELQEVPPPEEEMSLQDKWAEVRRKVEENRKERK